MDDPCSLASCSKDDLDHALQNASLFKDNEQQAETRKKAEQAQADLQAAEAEVGGGQSWAKISSSFASACMHAGVLWHVMQEVLPRVFVKVAVRLAHHCVCIGRHWLPALVRLQVAELCMHPCHRPALDDRLKCSLVTA